MSALQIDLPYLSGETDRHGRPRLYVRRFGRRVRLREKPGTPAFLDEYRAACDQLAGRKVERRKAPRRPSAIPGSLRWLGTLYFASGEFLALPPTSQSTRRGIIEACFREPTFDDDPAPMGDCPLEYVTPAKIRRLRDLKKGRPGAANNRRKYLSKMFEWAIEEGHMPANPVSDTRKLRYASNGFHSWTVEEVAQYEARHPIGTKARLALALLMFTGTRRGDMVTLGRQHVKGGIGGGLAGASLRFVARKGRHLSAEAIEIPVLPELAEVIAASPCGDLTFLVTDHGRAFTANGFGNYLRDQCDQANLHHCSAHGIRKAAATLAAERGATGPQLQAIFGWATLAQADVYIRAANRKKMAAAAMHLLGRESGS